MSGRDDAGDPDELVATPAEQVRASRDGPPAEVGEWYWVSGDEPGEDPWLGCVTHVGTNYVLLRGVKIRNSYCTDRVHFRDFAEKCRREPEAARIVAGKVEEQRRRIDSIVRRISAIGGRLCVGPAEASDTRAVATYDGGSVDRYRKDLARARDKSIPALQKELEEASEEMVGWMQAEAIPITAQKSQAEAVLESVSRRISAVEVYAGLVEKTCLVRDGAPAAKDERIRIFQRRHYMDEECLANYLVGGMRFRELKEFEEWLLVPQNLDRIMPYRRCAVAFRVRRNERRVKHYSFQDLVRFLFGGEKEQDMRTYLYFRNGERVSRLETAVDFGERLFPDVEHSVFASGQKIYAVVHFGEVEKLATEGEYLDLKRREAEHEAKLAKIPEEDRWRHDRFDDYPSGDFVPWNQDAVEFDDINSYVQRQLEDHNRLVLLLQGLLDRSEAFSPHPPCRLWDEGDFKKTVELVYDDSRAISAGDRPDFLAYQAEVNAGLRASALAVGQDDYWTRKEAERENDRLARRYGHEKSYYMRTDKFRPEGDPGPGVVARVASLTRDKKSCWFRWEKSVERHTRWGSTQSRVTARRICVPTSLLLCVDGYRPGDYHKFYDDPRTRADYLEWAPLLLLAEEWHAGYHRGEDEEGGPR